MLKAAPTLVVSRDIGRLHFHTAPEQAWSRMCAEADDGAPGPGGRVRNPRQIVGEPLHPQAMEVDAGKFCGELSAPRDRQLGPRCADCCRVIVGVGKGSE